MIDPDAWWKSKNIATFGLTAIAIAAIGFGYWAATGSNVSVEILTPFMTIAGAAVAGIAGYTIATYRKKDDDNTNLAPGKSGDQVLERSEDKDPPNPPDGNGGGNGNKVAGEKPTPTPGATDQPGTNKPDPAKGAASTDDKPATSLHTAICLTVIAGLAIAGAVLCYTIVKPADTSQAVSGIVRAAYATLQVNQSNHDDALNILGLPSSETSTSAKNLEANTTSTQPTAASSNAAKTVTAEWVLPGGYGSIKLQFVDDVLISKQMDPPSSSSAGWLASFLTIAGAAVGGIAGFTYSARKSTDTGASNSEL